MNTFFDMRMTRPGTYTTLHNLIRIYKLDCLSLVNKYDL